MHRLLRELHEEGGRSREAWDELRLARLREMLVFARDHVPYYRRLFAANGFIPEKAHLPDDLSAVPVLTKQIIRDQLDELIAETVPRSSLLENATGGSTGEPLRFYQDQRYKTVAAALDAYVRGWWGIRPYDRTASVWGADREFKELSLRERFHLWRRRRRSLNAFRMTEEDLAKFCRMLAQWRPPYLMGYSSALTTLATFARDHGFDHLRFRAIQSTAENLYDHQRQLIEEVFRSPVYNFYGSREVNNLAAECPEERKLHLISTWRYVEVVDKAGHPMEDGVPGYIVVTDLSNCAMPFIRYRNEDIGAISNEECTCGRPSPVVEQLLGRSTDLIRTPRGELVHGEYFTHLFYGRDAIAQFQVHQTALDRLVVRYVPARVGHEAAAQEIVERIRNRLGTDMVVTVEACDSIPLPPSGKHRFTLSDVHSPLFNHEDV